jgi:hypothetical protein
VLYLTQRYQLYAGVRPSFQLLTIPVANPRFAWPKGTKRFQMLAIDSQHSLSRSLKP